MPFQKSTAAAPKGAFVLPYANLVHGICPVVLRAILFQCAVLARKEVAHERNGTEKGISSCG